MSCPNCHHPHTLVFLMDKYEVRGDELNELIEQYNALLKIKSPAIYGKGLSCWLARRITAKGEQPRRTT